MTKNTVGVSGMNAQVALKSYSQVHVDAGVQGADPHRLIEMLFEGFFTRLSQAKGAINQKNMSLKSEKISSAINIVSGLRDSLDKESGGELAENLDGLYDYVQRTLWQASAKNDLNKINECGRLMNQISTAWSQIN